MKKFLRNLLFSFLIILLSVGIIAIPAVTLMLEKYRGAAADISVYGIGTSSRPTRLYRYEFTDRQMREGVEIEYAELTAGGQRIPVAYSELPENLINAFTAVEDKRFFNHRGVDFLRTAEAALNYILHFRPEFGASTITQQLIKNATGDDDTSPERKLREIFRASELEKNADKTAIFEAYVNIINLSDGCIGVGAAADRYFGKCVGDLTLAECASIAAITNNPAKYNPKTHPEVNETRRNLILSEMLEQGYIDEIQYNSAISQPVDTSNGSEKQPKQVNSWYTDTVIEDVKADLMREYGYTEREAISLIYNGGLKIYTAQDAGLQRLADEYFADEANFPTGDNGRPQAAVVIIHPQTGDVLALSGGIGEKTGDRIQNRAAFALHSPGSSIKPLSVYAPAIDGGLINWATVYDDSPAGETADGNGGVRPWPENGDKIYRGGVDIDYAVSASLNTVAVKVLNRYGAEKSFDFLKNKLKMQSLIGKAEKINDVNAVSLALGQLTKGLTLREITAGYTAFYDGIYRQPRTYYRVLDADGRVLLSNAAAGQPVISRETAAVMTKLLQNAVDNGTARGLTLDRTVECAGKTGTTQNNCDKWFIGYTPGLIAGVWLGYDYPKPLTGISGNPCLGIWDGIMLSAYENQNSVRRFEEYPGIAECSYCRDSGLLPDGDCFAAGRVKVGWFNRENMPSEYCGNNR